MFALRAEISRGPSEGRATNPAGMTYCHKSGIQIGTSLGQLYGFRYEYEWGLVIGESLCPISANRIEKTAVALKPQAGEGRLPDGDILGLVVVNAREKSIVAAASISSCRPYYYCFQDGVFYCSTSMRSLANMGVALEPDETTLSEYLVYRYVVPPRTLCRGISKLIGGQTIRADLTLGEFVDRRHYVFDRGYSRRAGDEEGVCRELDGMLRKRIGLSLEHHSRPAVLLSGGLDSSLLASVALSLDKGVRSASSSFSFVDNHDAETEYALSVAGHLGISHRVYEGSPEQYLSGLVESIYAAEEPVHHLQSVMLYLLFKYYAGAEHDVLICGEGADRLFGSDLHVKIHKYRRVLAFLRYSGGHMVYRRLLSLLGDIHYRWRFFAADFSRDLSRNHHILWTIGQFGDPAIVKAHLGCDDSAIVASYKALMTSYEHLGFLNQISVLSLLSEGFLTTYIWGKLAESQGIALHFPFTAPDLIDYVTGLPWNDKLKENKHFIRALLRRYGMAPEFIHRPKMSFGFPYQYWALPGSLLQPVVDMAGEMYEPAWLRSLQVVQPGHAMVLWNVVNYYLWRKLFVDRVSPGDLLEEVLQRHHSLQART